jgi:hypothetical protein
MGEERLKMHAFNSLFHEVYGECWLSYMLYSGPFVSSCIDRFIHVAFPARQIFFSPIFIDTFISSCFNRFLHNSARSVSVWDLSVMVRVWTCRAGQQWKKTYSMNEFSVVFKHIQVHFRHGQWKIDWISTGAFIFVWFTVITTLIFYNNPLNLYWDKRKYRKNFSLYRVQYSPSVFLLLSILWTEKRLRLRFSLFWIFFSSSNKIDITHNYSVDRSNMFTRRYELECFDVWWYESSHICRAGNATCMERSMQDDMNGLLNWNPLNDFRDERRIQTDFYSFNEEQ